jgi:hypothetical protein
MTEKWAFENNSLIWIGEPDETDSLISFCKRLLSEEPLPEFHFVARPPMYNPYVVRARLARNAARNERKRRRRNR